MATTRLRNRITKARKSGSRANSSRHNLDTANGVLKLKLEHVIVFQALEDANRCHQRAVGTAEIAQEIPTKDKKLLQAAYEKPLTSLIPKILTLLIARGLVFSPGAFNRRRSYGSVHVLNPTETESYNIESRRFRVLGLVRSAVTHYGRAVRTLEILSYAGSSGQVEDIAATAVTHDVLSLAETGELSVIGQVRGEGKGNNLYLPSDLDVDLYKPTGPLTWLDEVAEIVERFWSERVEEAKANGRCPRPLTTGDIRARIVESHFIAKREIKRDPQIIVDAVKNLATTSAPILRKMKRKGQKSLFWIPVHVKDEEIDWEDSYANDAERMGAAVQRAVTRLRRPVTVQDIQDEIDADFTLQPIKSSPTFQALSYAARATFDAYDGNGRRARANRRVFTVGRAGANIYYDSVDSAESRCFVEFQGISLKWSDTLAIEQFETLKTVSLPSIFTGRALLLSQEMESLLNDLSGLLAKPELDSATRREAEDLKDQIQHINADTQSCLDNSNTDASLPTKVMNNVAGWTATDFIEAIKPLYPLAENLTPHKLIRLMYRRVRQIPNPHFGRRFSRDSDEAAEFFFDRTDALFYTANRWGGPECSLQATLAKQQLGILRDPRFVFPALNDRSFETRLAAVACLAFLWSEEGNRLLRHLAIHDLDSGVRQSALWAYGFAGGEKAYALIRERGNKDPNSRVREFAKQATTENGSWFRL